MNTLSVPDLPPYESSFDGRPLVVDLDGTLIHTDMLHEVAIKLFKKNPFLSLSIPIWLMAGKAALKKKLSSLVEIDVKSLPYNHQLIEWLETQKQYG